MEWNFQNKKISSHKFTGDSKWEFRFRFINRLRKGVDRALVWTGWIYSGRASNKFAEVSKKSQEIIMLYGHVSNAVSCVNLSSLNSPLWNSHSLRNGNLRVFIDRFWNNATTSTTTTTGLVFFSFMFADTRSPEYVSCIYARSLSRRLNKIDWRWVSRTYKGILMFVHIEIN